MTTRQRTITAERLDGIAYPTLEEVLAFVNGGKYQKFFLKRPKVYPDGSCEEFTPAGARAYKKLICLLYAVSRLTRMDETYDKGYDMHDVVEELDSIVHESI